MKDIGVFEFGSVRNFVLEDIVVRVVEFESGISLFFIYGCDNIFFFFYVFGKFFYNKRYMD